MQEKCETLTSLVINDTLCMQPNIGNFPYLQHLSARLDCVYQETAKCKDVFSRLTEARFELVPELRFDFSSLTQMNNLVLDFMGGY